MIRFLLPFGLLLLPLLATAQSGGSQLAQLQQNGLLLVALPTRSKKTEAVRRELARPELTDEQLRNLEARLARIEADNARDARLLQQAFAAAYDFSEYRFTYDTVVVDMRDHTGAAYLLDDMLATVATDWPADAFYWVAQFGYEDGLRGLRVRTADLQPVPASVQDFYRFNTFASLFRALTKPKAEAELVDAQRMVARLHKEFTRRAAKERPEEAFIIK